MTEKRDPLDTFIKKAEEIRPTCPIEVVEDSWVKFTDWFVKVTPAIPILPTKPPFPITCEIDADCPPGYECVDGKCVVISPPGELPPGIVLESMSVFPKEVTLDGEVTVRCHLWNQKPEEIEFDLVCSINTKKLIQHVIMPIQWDKYVDFVFTPKSIGLGYGSYTVKVADKSLGLTVKKEVTGIFYSPFGCHRWPMCLEANGKSLDAWLNYIRTGENRVGRPILKGICTRWDLPINCISQTNFGDCAIYPACCEFENGGYIPYWQSREELAMHIALGMRTCSNNPEFATYADWIYWHFIRGEPGKCPSGPPKCKRPITWWGDPYSERDVLYTKCPYCDKIFKRISEFPKDAKGWLDTHDKYLITLELISHIERDHPEHPLNKPAW